MANPKHPLTVSNIKYMLVLHELSQETEGVRCVRIAELLGVSKPSVHTMINTLKSMGLVSKDFYGVVSFTEEGREAADRFYEYFTVIRQYWEQFLPDESDVRSAVCALIAEIDPDHLEAMCHKIQEQELSRIHV